MHYRKLIRHHGVQPIVACLAITAALTLPAGLVLARGGHGGGHGGGHHPGGGHHAAVHHQVSHGGHGHAGHPGGHAAAERSHRAHDVRNNLSHHMNALHHRPIGPQHPSHQVAHHNGQHNNNHNNNSNNHNNFNHDNFNHNYNNFNRNNFYGNGIANGLYGAGLYGNRGNYWWGWSSWAGLNGWLGSGWGSSPYYYDYGPGGNVAYSDGNVAVDGQAPIAASDYAQQAIDLAQSGDVTPNPYASDDSQVAADDQTANADDLARRDEENHSPLGVFALADDRNGKPGEAQELFQLAIDKQGHITGTAFRTDNEAIQLIHGAVDKKTQRAAWRVDGQPQMVYETGLFNLTQSESSILVHDGRDAQHTALLVHLHPAEDGEDSDNAPADQSPVAGPADEQS